MSAARLCRYEFTSESSFEIGSRGATCFVVRYDGRFPDSGPAELIDKSVQIDGKLFRCTGVEMFAVNEQSNYPLGLTFGIVVDPNDREEFVLGHVPYLMAETLAARATTGETFWTFPVALESAAHVLRDCGVAAMVQSGTIENTIRVWLSQYGRDKFLDDGYIPPVFRGAATAPSEPQEPEPDPAGVLGPPVVHHSDGTLSVGGVQFVRDADGRYVNAEPITIKAPTGSDDAFYARHPLPRPHLIAEVTSIAEEAVPEVPFPLVLVGGLPRVEFRDNHNALFRMGKSTLAERDEIWLGHHSLSFLTQEQVRGCLPYLVHFAYRGELRCAENTYDGETCLHDGILGELATTMADWQQHRWVIPE